MSENSPQVEAIFLAALEKATPRERDAYVVEACAGNPLLLEQVRELLESHDDSQGPLDSPPVASSETLDMPPILEEPGSKIGPYKLLQKIGEGGMGVVYMAEQKAPINRRVALKIIKPGMDTRQVIARFDAERQALALMDHPNIARVLDAGATDNGRPFFVMELVKGVPVTTYCDERHLSLQERLELFIPICQAVQHAHQKGIIHRDIKPTNILIAEYDHNAVPKIIDFGVAKALNQQLTEKTVFTRFDQVIGTLEYMSPEQAKLNQLDIDTRSDVYSLGAVLYELIAGAPPFESQRLRSLALDELLRVIREDDPPRPSMRLSSSASLPSLAATRGVEPRKLTTLVRGEIDWIVMKALDKERGRRYESANDFARDLQRYLNDDAVAACPPSALYRLRKFVRRNRTWIAASTVVLLTLVLGVVGTVSQHMVARSYYENEQALRKQLEVEVENVKQQKQIATRNKAAAERAVWDFYLRVSDSPELLGEAPGTQRLRKELLDTARNYYAHFMEHARSTGLEYERGVAWNRLGLVEADLGNLDAAIAAHEESTKLWRTLSEREPEKTEFLQYYASSILSLAKAEFTAGHLDTAEQHGSQARELLRALIERNPESRDYKKDLAWSHNVLGNIFLLRDDMEDAIEHYGRAIEVCDLLLQEDATDATAASRLAGCSHNISAILKRLGKLDHAVEYSSRSVEIAKKLSDESPESEKRLYELASFQTNLGVIISMQGNRSEALPLHRAALEDYRKLVERNPSVPDYREGMAKAHNSIGIILEDFGRPDEAADEYCSAIATREPMVERFPKVPEYAKELIKNYGNLARIRSEQGDHEAAFDNVDKAIDRAEKLTAEFTDTPEYRALLVQGYNQRGRLLLSTERFDEAEENLQRALELASDLAEEQGEATLYDSDLVDTLRNLALLANKRLDHEAAKAHYDRVIQILESLSIETRSNPRRLKNLSLTYANIADLLQAQGRQGDAIEEYQKAAAIAKTLFDNTSEVPENRILFAGALTNLGLVQLDSGDLENALANFSSAVEHARTLAAEYPDAGRVHECLNISRSNLALTYVNMERYADALRCYRQVVEHDGPETVALKGVKASAARCLAREFQRIGDLENAGSNFQLAVELRQRLIDSSPTPEHSAEMLLTCHDLGCHLVRVKDSDDARVVYQRGMDIGEQLVEQHPTSSHRVDLANLYFAAGNLERDKFSSATSQDYYRCAAELHEGLRNDASDTTVHDSALVKLYINLANGTKREEPDRRLELYGKAITVSEGLVDRFPEVLTYREDQLTAHLNQAIALDHIGKLPEASAEYRKAIDVPGTKGGDESGEDRLAHHRIPALVNLGIVQQKLKQIDEAIKCNEDAIEIGTRLTRENASQFRVQIETAGAQVNLAAILLRKAEYHKALDLLASARERLSYVLSHDTLATYARTFLLNSLATERRCYEALLRDLPRDADLELVETALASSIDWGEEQLKRWPTLDPKHLPCASHLAYVRNSRAWLRATDPSDDVRKGVEAVADATRACELTSYKVWGYIDTLAAAFAEVGSFDEAVQRQQQAIDMAPDECKQEMQQRLELYLNHDAYRQGVNDATEKGDENAPD